MCSGGGDTHDIEEAAREEEALTRQKIINRQVTWHNAVAKWHGALQAKFEIDTFGYTLYTPLNGLTVADENNQ